MREYGKRNWLVALLLALTALIWGFCAPTLRVGYAAGKVYTLTLAPCTNGFTNNVKSAVPFSLGNIEITDYEQESFIADYSLVEGGVTLLRNGREYALTSGLKMKLFQYSYTNMLATANGRIGLSALQEQLGEAYARTAGDIIVVEGTWSNGNYTFVIPATAVTVGEGDSMTVAPWVEEDLEGELARL